MTKTQFKTEMIKRGYKCIKFKNDMIFEYDIFLINIELLGNGFVVFVYDDLTGLSEIANNQCLSMVLINYIDNNIKSMIEFLRG